MSYSTLYRIDANGDIVHHQDFSNAFRGALLIWADFAARYGLESKDNRFLVTVSVDRAQKVWDLIKKPDLPRHHKIVMLATWDRRLCRSEDFPELIAALRQYHAELDPDDQFCHTAAWADAIAELPEGVRGCGWRHTSVNANPWRVVVVPEDENYDAEYRDYNIDTDVGYHEWIFDELREKYS